MDAKLSAILERVQKPSRYVGGEFAAPVVDVETRVRYCLCLPELYEDAVNRVDRMVVYYMLNDRKGYSCERCFAPWLDMGRELKKEKLPLFSLETHTALNKFDLLNFNFHYEHSYTTFLYMLDLAGIPFKREDRTDAYPLIYGSGICMANPEPLADFLDFAIIGDQEDVTIKVIDCIVKAKLSGFNKQKTLDSISMIDGVYVPSKVKVCFDKKGKISKLDGKAINRQIIRDLDRAYFPTKLLVPNDNSICQTGMIEAVRGCTKGCRYCQAGYLDRPVRERRVQTLVAQANAQVQNCGVKQIAVGALSEDGYSKTPELLTLLSKLCEDKDVKIHMSSLRFDNFNVSSSYFVGDNCFVMALEAGTERLRKIINKDKSDADIEQEWINAVISGFSRVELRFMIGLPYETSADIMGIVETVKKIQEIYEQNKINSEPLDIMIKIAIFVPKPFTPFQWQSFVGVKEAEKRLQFLEIAFKNIGVNFQFFNPAISEIEAIISRADRRVGQVLVNAYYHGAIFTSNDKLFDFNTYNVAFDKAGLSKNLFLDKKDINDVLAWDLVNVGIDKSFLISQAKMAPEAKVLKDCRYGCNGCGLLKMGSCSNGRI